MLIRKSWGDPANGIHPVGGLLLRRQQQRWSTSIAEVDPLGRNVVSPPQPASRHGNTGACEPGLPMGARSRPSRARAEPGRVRPDHWKRAKSGSSRSATGRSGRAAPPLDSGRKGRRRCRRPSRERARLDPDRRRDGGGDLSDAFSGLERLVRDSSFSPDGNTVLLRWPTVPVRNVDSSHGSRSTDRPGEGDRRQPGLYLGHRFPPTAGRS